VSQDQEVGFIIVGQKQSGSSFTTQDAQILEIIADEVAIAVQNTLRYEEIALFNVTLQKKINNATAELTRTNEKLKALDEAKDEFISMASHQLRTPLTSVKGYISMLIEGDAGEVKDQQRRFLEQAYNSSQRMVYLIADLLNVSRLKTGKFVIEPKPTYLPDVIESELAQVEETAKSRGVELVYNKPAEFPTLNIDETKIRQVIMNFVDNAIYYTPKGGKATVALNQTKDSVELTVTDTGIGVPKADQHKLFTKFYRANNARKARPDGTGLGIFMAKKVVAAQGGAIIFKTEEGKGSTFGFSFPRAKLEIAPPINK
jgi:signal transduction histidine kinase